MLARKIGIDLGTCTVRVYVKGEGVVLTEPSLVALNRDGTRVLAVGSVAYDMAERRPESVRVLRPIRDGVMADLNGMDGMLRHLMRRVSANRIFKPEIMVGVPSGASSAERRAVTKTVISAGARQAWLIDGPLAAAFGAGLSVAESKGSAVVDIGGGTTEIAVISLSGMVVGRSIKVGGKRIDGAVTAFLARTRDFLIGEREAEQLKIAIGSAVEMKEPLTMQVRGRDPSTGRERSLQLTSNDLVEAMREPLVMIASAIRGVLDDTPRELCADLFDRGIVLTGGGALLRGLDRYLAIMTGMRVMVAAEPQTSVVRGTGLALQNFEVLKRNQSYFR
ncbi:MAG: rod shape-determining protein [Candidatus Dormibacterales bacterium]